VVTLFAWQLNNSSGKSLHLAQANTPHTKLTPRSQQLVFEIISQLESKSVRSRKLRKKGEKIMPSIMATDAHNLHGPKVPKILKKTKIPKIPKILKF
jgi:hypothetical protein